MTENYKRIAKNTMFLYFRMLVIMGVSFYTVRIVLDTLGVSDFGIYNLVASFVLIMAFLNSTLASGTQRFLTFEIGKNNSVKLKQIFSIAIMIHIALAVIILILAETIGLWFLYEKMNIPLDRIDAAFWAYQFSILSVMVKIIQVPYNALIIAHERMQIFAYISIVEAILKLLIVYLLLVLSYDKLITYAILMFLVSSSIALFYRRYCKLNYQESHFEFVSDKEIIKSILHFSGWNIFGTLGSILANQGINIILNIFFGPIAVAARAVAMQVSNGLNQFVNGLQQAITPQITKLYASNQIEELNKLLYQNAKYAFLLLWFLALPVLIEIDYILHIWLVEVPENTVLFSRLILIQALIYSIDRPFVMAIHATGNMKQTNVTAGIILLLIIPISYYLLDNGFSIIVPFVVYIIATILCFIIELYYLKTWIDVSILELTSKTLLPISLIVILSVSLSLMIMHNMEESLLRFLTVSFSSVSSVILFSYFIGLNKEERIKINTMIRNKIKGK